MFHNDAAVAPHLYRCSGIRTLHDDAMVSTDLRSIFPRSFVYGQTPQWHRCHQDQEEKTQ
jgi:hypothetical protein